MSLLQRLERGLVRRIPFHPVTTHLQRPIASFSFDDVPASAAETGADILESRGVCGTYYVCGSLEGANYRDLPHFTRDHLVRLAAKGHEIGCHAFDHIPFPAAGPDALRTSVVKNTDYARETLGDGRFSSFAYPFGDVNWPIKSAVSRLYPIARGVSRGLNVGRMDFSELRANPLDMRWEAETNIPALIDAGRRAPGWLIFFTHDVMANPTPEGCHPDRLKATLDAVLEAGYEVLPIKSAAARARFG